MSTSLGLQNPYVLANLPRPIDSSNGRYVVSSVCGGRVGSKKRKRSEIAVGIDGEGVNLYDVSSARLITSYALSPQSSFTCSPCSLRLRASKTRVLRKTYISTTGPQPQILLFQDLTEGADGPRSTSKTLNLDQSSAPVVFIGTVTAALKAEISVNNEDLIIIKSDGEIQCLDGDILEKKWTSPAIALERSVSKQSQKLKVEHVEVISLSDAKKGLLKPRSDLLALFPSDTSENGPRQQLLFIITSLKTENSARTLHVVALPRIPIGQLTHAQLSVDSLLSVQLPTQDTHALDLKSTFSLQATTGLLQQLCGNWLTTFDLTETLPKEISRIYSADAKSFARISSTSVLISSPSSISIYNPKYQSLIANMAIESAGIPKSAKRKRSAISNVTSINDSSLEVIAYFQRLDMVVGIRENELLAVVVGGRNDRQGRQSGAGLLIDSLGCSTNDERLVTRTKIDDTKKIRIDLSTMASCISRLSDEKTGEDVQDLHDAFSGADATKFDSILAQRLGVNWNARQDEIVGNNDDGLTNRVAAQNRSAVAPDIRLFSGTNRRWIPYLLSQVFTLSRDKGGEAQLSVTFYPLNTFTWLIRTGSMTTVNVESALRKYQGYSPSESLPVGALIDAIVELDPDMDLLLALLASTPLEADDLLRAVRILMESLELFGENQSMRHSLLDNGDVSAPGDENVEKQVERLEMEADEALQLAEYQLGPGSGVRGQALTLALSKLYTSSNSAIIAGLQTTFSSHEIVSLIYLLRFELARGAWTSRYLDTDLSSVIDDDAEIPNNAIVLIASLLNNCVDAVGAGGWLSGDARLLNKDPFEAEELITSLKLEISAALEGLEEAVYLRGLTSEMIRYGDVICDKLPMPLDVDAELPGMKTREFKNTRIVFVPLEQDSKTLPLGMKAQRRISRFRVGAGGEVQQRSQRDIGQLKSQRVGKYSLERIIV